MRTIKYIIFALVAVLGLGFASKAQAAQLKDIKITMADSRPTATNAHTYTFKHTTAATIKKMTFQYCKNASVACGANSTDTTLAAKGAIGGLTGAEWEVTNTAQTITLFDVVDDDAILANTSMSLVFNGIVNGAMTDACDATSGVDTCYVWITSYAADGTTPVDTGVGTYTLVDAVIVTAKVDPTFTFVVSAVNANTVNNQITASVTSTANTLPFGSLQAGTPRYAAHRLNVTTNTQGGYSVTTKMADQMTGVYTDNNIDPFIAPWTTPTTWTEPTGGTPNDNTGWIGANTTDTDVTNWTAGTAEKFGAIGGTPSEVSYKSSSDNGTAGVYVTYAIEANVFQPSDSYRGNIIYNALPTY